MWFMLFLFIYLLIYLKDSVDLYVIWTPIYRSKTSKIPQTTRNPIAPSSQTTHPLVDFPKTARLISSHLEKVPRAIVFHVKKKFCKVNIFIPPFLIGPDMWYKKGHYGILPNRCHVAPSPLATKTIPLRHVTSPVPSKGILYGRRSNLSGCLSAGACHRIGGKCDSTSSIRFVRILLLLLPGVPPRLTVWIPRVTRLMRRSQLAGSISPPNLEGYFDDTIDQIHL